MKQITFCLAVATLYFISCKNSPTNMSATNHDSEVDSNIAKNQKIYQAIRTGNFNGVDSIIATDAVDHDGPKGTEVKGRDSIVSMLSTMHNQIKDLNIDVISTAGNKDYVFSLVHISGTPDSSMGMDGRKIDQKGVDLVKFSNGKITDHWGFSDDIQVAKEMMELQQKTNDMGKMKK